MFATIIGTKNPRYSFHNLGGVDAVGAVDAVVDVGADGAVRAFGADSGGDAVSTGAFVLPRPDNLLFIYSKIFKIVILFIKIAYCSR